VPNDKKISKLSLGAINIIFFLFLLLIMSRFLRVEKINCFVNSTPTTDICQNFNSFRGKSLLLYDFSTDNLFEKLLTNQDKSHSYHLEQINKKLPNTLNIFFTSKPPTYRIALMGNIFLVSEKGQVKKNIEELELVSVFVDEQWLNINGLLINDSNIEDNLHDFLNQLVRESENRKMNLKEIKLINQAQIELYYLDEKFKFIIEKNNSVLNNIERIDIILKNFDFEAIEKNISEIDMRFKFPVLK
jgi:hypothetical protein